jgi:hypothetical protein
MPSLQRCHRTYGIGGVQCFESAGDTAGAAAATVTVLTGSDNIAALSCD